jgi:hypothetical protein
MDETDSLRNEGSEVFEAIELKKFKKVEKIKFGRNIFENLQSHLISRWQLIDMQTIESITNVSSHRNQRLI